jgi:hypothetical protein
MTASPLQEQARVWAEGHACSLRVLNDGHHWLFQKPGFMSEWWPGPIPADWAVIAPETHRSLAVVPLQTLQRYYGEAPVRFR